MLWTKYGWTSTIYEAGDRVGGRCETQRGYWANGLVAEMHGEFISSEHASMLNLVKQFNLGLDDTRAYAAGTEDTYWVNGGRYTQAQLNADWQAWAWTLFNDAIKTVPWPQRYNSYNATGYQWDHMDVPTWMNQYLPGGTASNFGGVCLQSQIDEYGGDPIGPVRAQPHDDPRLLRQRQRAWLAAHRLAIPGRHGRAVARHRRQRPDRQRDGEAAAPRARSSWARSWSPSRPMPTAPTR